MQKVQALRDIKTDLEELSTHQNHDNDRLDLCICRIIECVFLIVADTVNSDQLTTSKYSLDNNILQSPLSD